MLLPLLGGGGFIRSFDWLSSSLLLPSGATFTRPQTADGTVTAFDSSGSLVYYNANQPRFDYDPVSLAPLGLLMEPQRTNGIRNAATTGGSSGSPGSLFTNWGYTPSTGASGLTRTITIGTYGGVAKYIDIRIQGPVGESANTFVKIFPENSSTIAATLSQWFSVSAYISIVNGSLPSGVVGLGFDEWSGTFLASRAQQISSFSTQLQKYCASRQVLNASTTYVRPFINVPLPSNTNVDFTIRITLPQTEVGTSCSSWIPTSTTAVTRAKDTFYIDNPSWMPTTEGTLLIEGTTRELPPNTYGYFGCLTDGTSNNILALVTDQTGKPLGGSVVGGTVRLSGQTLSALPVGTNYKAILGFKAGQNYFGCNGVMDTDGIFAAAPVPPFNKLYLADRAAGDRTMMQHIKRVSVWNKLLPQSAALALIS